MFLQDLNQPKVEATLPVGLLSVPLLRHQVLLLLLFFWSTLIFPLFDSEISGTKVKYYIFQKIALAWMLQKETTSLHCLGGILADDQVTN